MEHIGDRIRIARLNLELSQSALAKRANVSQGTIGQLESGRNQSSAKIVELASALNVSPEWLLYGKNPPSVFQKPENIETSESYITSEISAVALKKEFLSEISAVALKKEFLKAQGFDVDYVDFIRCIVD